MTSGIMLHFLSPVTVIISMVLQVASRAYNQNNKGITIIPFIYLEE